MPCLRYSLFPLLIAFLISPIELNAQTYRYEITDEASITVPDGFYGIQYHSNSYNDPDLLGKMAELPVESIRLWAKPHEYHPEPGVWDWELMDTKISEITAAGYEPIVGFFQSEDWYTGSPENPWWNNPEAVEEWYLAVDSLVKRYQEQLQTIILFDELNYLNTDQNYYISFSQAADLYIETASRIKAIKPELKVGGPSGFNGWENGHFANYVFRQTTRDSLLGFISSNIFLSWDKDDSDKKIMDRTIWYEEAPLKIKTMLESDHKPQLMLDAYNASALWTIDGTKDGELWTDPRNTNAFGGVYQTLAQFHAAKGGFDISLKWETIGGYGIFNWYPAFKKLPPYYAWKLVSGPAGLLPGADLYEVTTTEAPLSGLPHHSGMDVKGYSVQPFAVRDTAGQYNLILINKYKENRNAEVLLPEGTDTWKLYRFDENRTEHSTDLLEEGRADTLSIQLPGESVSVIQFSKSTSTGNEYRDALPDGIRLKQNYPNPFNPVTLIPFELQQSSRLRLELYNAAGVRVRVLTDEIYPAGTHTYRLNASGLSSGVYFYRLSNGDRSISRRMILIK